MRKVVEKTKQQVKETKEAVFIQSFTLVNGAFALVAALAWNEAVKALIERVFPAGSDLVSKFIYAIGITVFVVFITRYLKQIETRFKQEPEQK